MLCCVCVTSVRDVLGVFDESGVQLHVAEIIEKHLWFKPRPNDDVKPKICTPCWQVVSEFHEFYNKTEEAYHKFHTLEKETILIKEEDEHRLVEMPIKEELDEIAGGKQMRIEVEIEPNLQNFEYDEQNNIERNPLDNDTQSVETDDVFENDFENDDVDLCDSSSVSSSSDCSSIDKKLTKKVVTQKKVKKKTLENKRKLKQSKETEDGGTRRKRKRLDPKMTAEMIQKHIRMICNLCNVDCKTFIDVGIHFKEQHPKVKPFIVCCNKKFTRRHYIAQHALQHENPNCFRCDKCNKSFKTTYNLHTHNLSFHNEEEKGTHACELCPQTFARRKLLEFHKPTHIPKESWSFFCMKCPTPRPFASEYLLKTHESVHKRETNICHVCAKEIKDKYLFEKHVRLHFEDSGPRVKCPYPDCESWLKDDYNLKDHLRRHNSEGIIYKCPQCEKVCKNRKALSQHKRNNHSDKVYTCSQCEKSFKKKITLKEHMAHHTGESLYKCPFCPRTFNSNANMYSHKKKQHPVE